MNSKQRWMGGVVLLGGGVLLAALLLKGKEEIDQKNIQAAPMEQVQQQKPASPTEQDMVQLQPLAVDVETEKRLLEEQRRAREKAVAEQEARAAEFLRMQQEAEAAAARKAAEEYAALNARRRGAQESSDNIPPELVDDSKTANKTSAQQPANTVPATNQTATQQQQAQKKEAERKLDEQRKLDAQRKAAEDVKRQQLEAQKKVEAQKKAEAEQKAAAERERKALEEKKRQAEAEKKAAAEQKLKAEAEKKAQEESRKKAEAEKARKLLEEGDDPRQWMVQVALAANEANADAIVSKLRAKGYKVTRSPTSKGIRIMVGPAKDREAADDARKKIVGDGSLDMKSAWVIEWVPLDKR